MSSLGKSKKDGRSAHANAIPGAHPANRRVRTIGSSAALSTANEYCLRHYAVGYTGGTPRRLSLPSGPVRIVPVLLTSAGFVGEVGMVVVDACARQVVGATAR